jgi:putative addiction module component (TIGR02574 family)
VSARAQRLLEDALDLPLEERADLAYELMASLDGPADPDAQAAWTREIERRARRAMTDAWQGVRWEDLRARLRSRLDRG